MEATGHYWKNLFATLATAGHSVALLNPLRTLHFAGEQLERTKTDAIDAPGLARFATQKQPTPTRLPEATTERWSGATRNWWPVGAVVLNPERAPLARQLS